MPGHPTVTMLRRLALSAGVLTVFGFQSRPARADSEAAGATKQTPPVVRTIKAAPVLRADSLALTKGARQLGYALGFGFGTPVLGSHTSDNLALGSLRMGWVLDRHWEVLCDLWGGARVTSGARGLGGFTPTARYRFNASGNWLPFVSLGSGPSYADLRGIDLGSLFEFNTQVGVGSYYFLRDNTALTVEYRWLHLSNAGLKAPNGGMNTQVLFVGLATFF